MAFLTSRGRTRLLWALKPPRWASGAVLPHADAPLLLGCLTGPWSAFRCPVRTPPFRSDSSVLLALGSPSCFPSSAGNTLGGSPRRSPVRGCGFRVCLAGQQCFLHGTPNVGCEDGALGLRNVPENPCFLEAGFSGTRVNCHLIADTVSQPQGAPADPALPFQSWVHLAQVSLQQGGQCGRAGRSCLALPPS